MPRDVPALLLAGFSLALMELAWVLTRGHAFFLSGSERAAYAEAALTAIVGIVAALGMALQICLSVGRRGAIARVVAGVLATPLAGWALWLLTAGRRVRDTSLRPFVIASVALAAGWMVFFVLRMASALRGSDSMRRRVSWSSACALLCLLALVADALVLPRSYPAFHVALAVLAAFSAALGGSVWKGFFSPKLEAFGLGVTALCLLLAAPALIRLSAQPNASYAVREKAPWSAKLLSLVERREPRAAERDAARARSAKDTSAVQARGIDLRDRDVLLITIDALRADLLTAYGGDGLTPELDALARDSVVFRRAYTPAPHTSYALASLLTAKFVKPVLELPGESGDHATLPDVLRRYGYRTAAFYPPAIFFVDGARFDGLRGRGFGFEYRKEMFAPAQARVAQLEAYLAQAEPKHPLFVWVHLFEPHEPYEPPRELVREDSARGRYDGEVMLSDRAVGELVRAFRAKRPGGTVIVSADHGEEFGDHGGLYHGTTLYDEQVRVPLLWSSPGVVAPAITDVPVELVDVGTTLLSAAGIPRDARMRGDDLGAVLAGRAEAGPRFAFSSVEDRHMVTDGHLKALCAATEAHCQLFDLDRDPKELRNLAGERRGDVARLRAELDAFLSSIPRLEALAVGAGVGFPEPLARAKLGAPGAGPEVIPLLADPRPLVRSAAARALGELSVASALAMLDRLRLADPDAAVRAEASIAALSLGAEAAAEDVVKLLQGGAEEREGLSQARRAALALAQVKRAEAVPALAALALDEQAQELDRLRAVAALGRVGSPTAVEPLTSLLPNVRLRPAVADALAALGGRRAADALARQLANERYQPARRALARALQKLNDRRTVPLVTRLLGMETSVPDGVRILIESKALNTPSARGALLSNPSVRAGDWSCAADACTPAAAGAELHLPARGMGKVRVTLLIQAEPGAVLTVDDQRFVAKLNEDQLSFERPSARAAARLVLAAEGRVGIVAAAVVPLVPEIPPPPPEPWDGGVPQAQSAEQP